MIATAPPAGWQPIETAARDCTEFLAAVEVELTDGSSRWDMHIISLDDETGEVRDYQGWDADDYTHWMPLPPPPAPRGGE